MTTSRGISVGATVAAKYGSMLVRLPSPSSEPEVKVLRLEGTARGGQVIAEIHRGVVRTLSAGPPPEVTYEEDCL